MSTNRRSFLRAGGLLILSTATQSKLAKQVFGQGPSKLQRDIFDGFNVPQGSLDDSLTYFTMSTFAAQLDSVFQLRSINIRSAMVTLIKVSDTAPTELKGLPGRECFVLQFRSSKSLPQDTYTVSQPALGTFQLLMVPGKDSKGAYLESVINRLYS
jgi:hypothetical protein